MEVANLDDCNENVRVNVGETEAQPPCASALRQDFCPHPSGAAVHDHFMSDPISHSKQLCAATCFCTH
eukprot:5838089-Amphidinium_carterae.1